MRFDIEHASALLARTHRATLTKIFPNDVPYIDDEQFLRVKNYRIITDYTKTEQRIEWQNVANGKTGQSFFDLWMDYRNISLERCVDELRLLCSIYFDMYGKCRLKTEQYFELDVDKRNLELIGYPANKEKPLVQIDVNGKLFQPIKGWMYKNKDGADSIMVLKYNINGRLHFEEMYFDGEEFIKLPRIGNLPPLNLHILANERLRNVPVLFVRGEEQAQKAQEMFPDMIVTTFMGELDWIERMNIKPFNSRNVYLMPKNNEDVKMAFEQLFYKLDLVTTYTKIIPMDCFPLNWNFDQPAPAGVNVEDYVRGFFIEKPKTLSVFQRAERIMPSGESKLYEQILKTCSVVFMGSKIFVAERTDSGEVLFYTQHAFESKYANKWVYERNPETGLKQSMSIGRAFFLSSKRKSYDKVVFKIDEKSVAENELNLFVPIQPPKEGDGTCDEFLDHMKNTICNGNEETFKWLFAWFAQALQCPWEKNGTCPVITGAHGTGKNFMVDTFGRLFGDYYFSTSLLTHAIGNFNSQLAKSILFLYDEARLHNEDHYNIFKSLVTSETIPLTFKGKDTVRVPNCTRFILLSNDDFVVRSAPKERRWMVMKTADTPLTPQRHDEIKNQMLNGGDRDLYDRLMSFDLEKMELRKIPKTNAKSLQVKHSLGSFDQWISYILKNNKDKDVKELSTKVNDLFVDYVTFYRNGGLRDPIIPITVFPSYLKNIFPSSTFDKGKCTLSIEEGIKMFEKRTDISIE